MYASDMPANALEIGHYVQSLGQSFVAGIFATYLGLIVGERDIGILDKAQHVGFALTQAQQQIVPRPPRRPAAGAAGRADEWCLALVQGKPMASAAS
jgi:hypothetical protein